MSSVIPDSITEIGGRVDNVHLFLILMMVFWFIACNVVMIYFMFRYRRKSEDQEVTPIKGHHLLEVAWTVIPTVLVLIIFYFGIDVWTDMRTPPENAMEIKVKAQKWSWSFTYPDGQNTAVDLYVPQGEPVKLIMNSADVLHSLFIPEFRVKEDVVPSMFTYLWFQADKPGVYNIFCTEYCGKDHSAMLGKVHVLDPETWERFQLRQPLDPNEVPKTPMENGRDLYTKRGCGGCHSTDGNTVVGPTFAGLFGREELMADGSTIVVDENYLAESIKYPKAKVVKGYPDNQMPSFDGQLDDDQISDIITFIKSLD